MELHQLMEGGPIATSTPAKHWDSAARRYVEHDTSPTEAFGELPVAGGYVKDARTAANDDLPKYAGGRFRMPSGYRPPWGPLGQPYVDDHPRQPGERRGDWMQLYSGKQFWPMDPRADEVEIEDIAHALSMQCRYAGHCKRFYSVAEHCVHLANYVSAPNRLWALLHDASEAYLVDVPRPVKPFLPGYKEAEARVMAVVCDRFGLPHEMPAEVHAADGAIIGDERANMKPCVAEWYSTGGPLGIALRYWTPEEAEYQFLWMFNHLMKKRAA